MQASSMMSMKAGLPCPDFGISHRKLVLAKYQKRVFLRLELGVMPLVLGLTGTELGAHLS